MIETHLAKWCTMTVAFVLASAIATSTLVSGDSTTVTAVSSWVTYSPVSLTTHAVVVTSNPTTSTTTVSGDSTIYVETVERRSSRDIYNTMNTTLACLYDLTYLVVEDRCVNNEDLLRGMMTCLAHL